jgi:predicted ATPase/class 3 adenylate cyclase/Tfp pilus assembly protein PilF
MPPTTPALAGTVTFLFTDIEGSTALWEQDGARMSQALAAHDALVRTAVESRRGTVVKMTGDGMHAAFDDALDAIAATVDLQQALADPVATHGVALRVRCGLHAGVVERRDNDYFGSPVNRAARIMSAAHGGQVLLSQAVVDGMRQILPVEVSLRDLGKVRLKDMSNPEHVYQVVHPDLRQQFPALRSLEAIPNNLPQQVSSFVGREQALAELKRLLARVRLLTLTGSGGCGKTRLGLQVAADSLERFPDGVWLVELSSLVDPGLVPQTVATVLGLKEAPGEPISQTLTEHLKDRRLLLMLDNCEHLLDGCARLVDTLMRQCPPLTILASSREALGIGGEQAYRVPSLSHPDPKYPHTPASIAPFEAVQLFADRALLARTDFRVTDQNASTLASICYRLDGIPLAIELAAARVRSLSAEEINSKLDQRFRLLTGGSRTALPRQQTLRSLIDWSYDLLHEPEKLLLQRLSVFAGGWMLEAAEQVCGYEGVAAGDVLDLLTSLCDKSLVVVERNDGHSRYRLLETVRQYSRERLFESRGGEAVRDQHRKFFLTLAEEAEPTLTGGDQAVWLRCLEEEHDNLRSALEWSHAEAGPETELRLCGALGRFWEMRTHLSEGREWCARALSKADAEERTPERAKVLNVTGTLAWHQADYPAARKMHGESLAIMRELGDRGGIARSLNNLGLVAWDQGDYPSARALHEESLAIRRELGDQGHIARSLNNLGLLAFEQGDFPSAQALHEESLSIVRELDDRSGIATSLNNLANVASAQADHPAARRMYGESLAIVRELGDRSGIANSLNNLSLVATEQGDYSEARALLEESLAIMREMGEQSGIATSLNALGSLAFEEGDYPAANALNKESLAIRHELGERRTMAYSLVGLAEVIAAIGDFLGAARIWGAAERLREEIGSPLAPNEETGYDRRVGAARAALGNDAAFDHAWQEGRALSLDNVIALAMQTKGE